MYKYDESNLIKKLARLDKSSRVAFAAAVATRQLPNFEWYAKDFDPLNLHVPRETLTQVWDTLQVDGLHSIAWEAVLDTVMNLLPVEEDDEWGIKHALAADALSSLAYSIRCFLKGDPQEAAWAALCGYESAEKAWSRIIDPRLELPGTEVAALSSEPVQGELRRQQRDLELLQLHSGKETSGGVQRLAYLEDLLSDNLRATLL